MLSTRAGWIGRVEVVEVVFDPRLVSYETLLERARDRDCAQPVFARGEAQEKLARALSGLRVERSDAKIRDVEDDKYHLSRSPLRFLPMTQAQRTRANAGIAGAKRWLSPRQLELLALVEKQPEAGWPLPAGRDLRADMDAARACAIRLAAKKSE